VSIPAWTIDLRKVGFTGFAAKREQWGINLRPDPLSFSGDQVLIATFITRETTTTLARRSQSTDLLPLRLHGVFLDATSGQVRTLREWSITRPRGGIISVVGGGFAVLTPSGVTLYSQDLEHLRDLKLSPAEQSDLWDFHSSPSARSIVAEYHAPDAYFQWIDTSSLVPRPVSIPTVVFSISDDDVAIGHTPYLGSRGFLSEVLVRTDDGPWRAICRMPSGQAGSCGNPQFLNNEVLALRMPHGFSVVTKDGGDPLLKESFRADEWLGDPLYPSAGGKRFAVTIWAQKGGSAFLDISYHSILKRVVVYDLVSRRAVYSLDAKTAKMTGVSGVALSPDGSLMGLLTDGVVKVYQLPISGSSR
jgi:hypothetical protein